MPRPTRTSAPAAKPRRDLAQEITDQIVARLEEGGELPWRQPWKTTKIGLPLRHEGTAYRGINVFLLALSAMAHGYGSAHWMTYRQAGELGGQVRKGERATTVVFYGTARDKRADDEASGAASSDEDGDRHYRFLKSFAVFNACQIDGLSDRYRPDPAALDGGARRPEAGNPLVALAEAMTAGLGVGYAEGGERACYSPGADRISMPALERFESVETYLATRFHEHAHATEVPARLGIDYGPKIFGNEAYAKGELYAELTAALLGAHLGFAPGHIDDHAAYVQSWLKVLRGDKRFILKAAADAQRGVDYLLDAAERGCSAVTSWGRAGDHAAASPALSA
ncbi:MAG: ArdC-like ssDNA-binding domain-containing protein [Pseudomonadota bacterium]